MSNLIRGGFDKLQTWINLNAKEHPIFTIYPDENKTTASYVLATNTDQDSYSLISTLEHLKQFFEISENGLFHIRFRKNVEGRANNTGLAVNFMYVVGNSTPTLVQPQAPVMAGISGMREGENIEDLISRKANEAFKTYLLEKENTELKDEVRRLKKELKEFETKNGERMDKIISVVAPALGSMFSKPTPQPQPTAIGMQDQNTELQKRWENVIDYFSNLPDGIDHLEALVKLHAKNPSMYAQGVGMIKNMI